MRICFDLSQFRLLIDSLTLHKIVRHGSKCSVTKTIDSIVLVLMMVLEFI